MLIHSPLSQKVYLGSLRVNMDSHFDLGSERFTGFFLANCFYVTHHAGYEWNRRITNQKNAAMGYVKKCDNGCEVHFLQFRGALCPLVFIPMLLVCTMLYLLSTPNMESMQIWLCIGVLSVFAPISALVESFTERSEDGRRSLLSMLADPSDPYKNYRHIP